MSSPISAPSRARSPAQRRPVAHARLSPRRLRRPHLPGHARHRRSRRSRRAHAADRQLGSLQLRRRPRVGRELQLDQDDHPGPQRGRSATDRHGSTRAATAGTRSTPSCSGRRCASQTPSSCSRSASTYPGPEPARELWRAPAGKTPTLHWWTQVSASERCRPLSNTCARSPSPANSARSRPGRTGRPASPMSPRSTGGSPSNTACRTSTRSWLRSTTTSSST